MLSLFESLKSLVRLRTIVTDNAVFQLHYRWTVAILLAFSILVTLRQYWGEAIQCVEGDKRVRKVVEQFCWTETTFTIPSAENLVVGVDVPYPGIKNSRDDTVNRRYHAYYQWVGLTLFFQALLLCIPRFIWKSEEGGLMRQLVTELEVIVSKKDASIKEARLVSYLKSSWGTHDKYVVTYMFCEMANFVSVVLQLVLMETFLGGKFTSYAMEVLGGKRSLSGQSTLLFPGFQIFPKMTKCIFYDYGGTGDVQKQDYLCLMPLNVIHEKLYVFLFLWYLGLVILSGYIIVLRLVSILQLDYRQAALTTHVPSCPKATIGKVCRQCSFSDWFFLKMICKNTSPQHSRKIILELAEEKLSPHGLEVEPYSKKTLESQF